MDKHNSTSPAGSSLSLSLSLSLSREGLPIALVKLKSVYQRWLVLYRSFPKVERLGIGQKVERALLDVLELIFVAGFTSPAQKLPMLGKAISRLDIAKFFLQIAWEGKLLTDPQYLDLLTGLEEVGKMLYGWRKGLESKTPPT